MLDKLKEKILIRFPNNDKYQACHLFDLIQEHINNMGLEGEEIAKLIIDNLHETGFLLFEHNYFDADKFSIRK